MTSYDPGLPQFRRESWRWLAILAVAAGSAFVVPLDSPDRTALLVALAVTTALRLRGVRRGGPRGAGDYLLVVWVGLAIAGVAVALGVRHLAGDHRWASVAYGGLALALLTGSAAYARISLFLKRVAQLLEPEEVSRAVAVGITGIDGRRKRVAVMVTDRRLVVAAPGRGQPRVVSQCDLARVGEVDVRANDGFAEIELRADGTTFLVRRVLLGQALRLAAAIGPKAGEL
jgi:hypothetical protein